MSPPVSRPAAPRASPLAAAVAAPADVSDDDYDDGGEEAGRPLGALSRSSSFSDVGGESTDTEVRSVRGNAGRSPKWFSPCHAV